MLKEQFEKQKQMLAQINRDFSQLINMTPTSPYRNELTDAAILVTKCEIALRKLQDESRYDYYVNLAEQAQNENNT